MFGRSPVRQFCLPQNLTKHFEKRSESQREPPNLSKMDVLWISTNIHEFSVDSSCACSAQVQPSGSSAYLPTE